MSLREKQSKFALLLSHLIQRIYERGYEITLGEAYRPQHIANYYAIRGRGVRNSFHTKRLAIDLHLFKDGEYLTKTEDHKEFGEYWESLDPECTWGGRFNDGNHYSYGEK